MKTYPIYGCVQCNEEMEVYGEFSFTFLASSEGRITGVKHNCAYRCMKLECPNYNLLQGRIEAPLT